MKYIFSNSCNIITNTMAEHSIEENFVECVENTDCEFTGRQQEKIYQHLNPPADLHIDEKWDTTNDLDVFAQWIDTGTNKQKDVVFKQILGFCCVAAFEQLATADERTNMVERSVSYIFAFISTLTYLLLLVLMLLLIRYSFMYTNFHDFLENYPKTAVAKEYVLSRFPGGD